MNNAIAFSLFALIVGFFAFDSFVLDGQMTVFLGRKFLELVRYVAFWR